MEIKELQPIVNFIYSVADDVLVNYYEKAKYKDIILPMTVIRRLDVVLEPTKETVVKIYNEHKDQFDNMDDLLGGKNGSKLGFHNHSNFTLKTLLDDPSNIRSNFENYLNGFSADVQDILEKFEFRNQVAKLERTNTLYATIGKFCSSSINLSPNEIKDENGKIVHHGLSNLGMGYVFEELLRRFNEDENAQAGKHFTPREIISLMTNLVFVPLKDEIKQGTYFIYDNACGSGGILSEAKQFITDKDGAIGSEATIKTFGQEASDEIFAICKSDMMIRGENPNNIKYGSTLSDDQLGNMTFDFMLTNPPFGTPWKIDQKELGIEGTGQEKKLDSCNDSRFHIGITDVGDGQMMFMQNMLAKMKRVTKDTPLGSHIASIHNGSSLFSGDAGSGESNIRKYIIENDMLEAIIELPKDMFYNTNISTYIWLVTNNKKNKGKIKLISASSEEFYKPMSKSLGKKRNEMTPSQITKLTELFMSNEESKFVKIFDNEDFGYSKVTIDRPLRLEYKNIESNIEIFKNTKEFEKLKDDKALELLNALKTVSESSDDTKFFKELHKNISFKPTKGQVKLIRDVFANVNKKACEVYVDPFDTKKGLLADSDLRDSEKIPLKQDIQEYFDKEVKPFVPDAWIVWDSIKIGYEILFNKYFYEYKAPRKLEDIYKDIKALEEKTENLFGRDNSLMLNAKKYDSYKQSGVEFIKDIPEHWEIKKLKYLVDKIIGGGTPLTSNSDYWTENRDDGLLWVAIADITKSEYLVDTKKYITKEGLQNSSAQRIEPYSILYSIYASLGKVAYSPYELTTNQAILAIKSSEELLYKFLFYYLKTLEDKLPFLSSSTTQNNISLDVVKNFNITQPPYDEQEKIVKFIDMKSKEIEEFISDKKKQIALLEEQKEAIINQAVTKGLDETVEFKGSGIEWIGNIPKHWNIMKMTHIFEIIGSGTTPLTSNSDYYNDGSIYWINSGDLNNGFVNTSSKLITQIAVDEVSSLKMYDKGALIIAMYGATIGKLGLLDVQATVNQACCVLDKSEKMINKFAFYWFLVNKKNIINLGMGGGQPNISQDIIKALRVQTPPKDEQVKIIKYIETEELKIDEVIHQIQKEIKLIEEYKISLISEVVTGQIDVR